MSDSEIVKINPKVTERCCPKCGYIISQVEADKARFNCPCPNECGASVSEFQPLNLTSTACNSNKI